MMNPRSRFLLAFNRILLIKRSKILQENYPEGQARRIGGRGEAL